jgi:hypothetical protein
MPKALFVVEKSSTETVWVTDGTSVGTFQLPATQDAGYEFLYTIEGEFQPFGNKLIYFYLEPSTGVSFPTKLQIYITDGTTAGTTEYTIGVNGNNLVNSIEAGEAAQVGDKFLIFDQAISTTGQPPTLEFFVTDGTSAGTTTFTIPGPPLPLSFNPGPFFSWKSGSVFGNRL